MHIIAQLHTMSPQQLSQAARITGIEQDPADAARASSKGETVALSMQLLEDRSDTGRRQAIFHPVVLLLSLGACPPAAYSRLDAALAALMTAAASGGAADTETDASGAVASFARLLITAESRGSSGGKIAAAAAMRTYLFIGDTLRKVERAGAGGNAGGVIWAKERVAAVEAACAGLEGDLVQRMTLQSLEASGAAEVQAFFDGGVDAVASVFDEIDAGCDADGGMRGLQMMVPADWRRARGMLGDALCAEPPTLHARAPRVLIIAGSDSSGGAGIQADIKACQANGAYAMTAISALTAQNTQGVQGVMGVPCDFLEQQILSCLSDIRADVIKTGMLGKLRAWLRAATATILNMWWREALPDPDRRHPSTTTTIGVNGSSDRGREGNDDDYDAKQHFLIEIGLWQRRRRLWRALRARWAGMGWSSGSSILSWLPHQGALCADPVMVATSGCVVCAL